MSKNYFDFKLSLDYDISDKINICDQMTASFLIYLMTPRLGWRALKLLPINFVDLTLGLNREEMHICD